MEILEPNGVYESSAPNSRAVVHNDTVYVSGIVGISPDSGEYGDSMAEQTRYAFQNLEATLEEADSALDQVLRILVFMDDEDDKSSMDEVYREFLSEPYPARAAMFTEFSGVTQLEIVATAYR